MPTLMLNNFEFTSSAELSKPRQVAIVSAVLQARSIVKDVKMKTDEVQSVARIGGFVIDDLPTSFLLHFRTLFRCPTAPEFLRTLPRVIRALEVLDSGLNSPALRFKEYGTDTLENIINAISTRLGGPSVYDPSTLAHVRSISINPITCGSYMGSSAFEGCLNSGRISGNPNEIMVKLTSMDRALVDLIDTVIHESSHKFLGTDDEGMKGSSFGWMANNGLQVYRAQNGATARLPCETPGFLTKTPDEAISNAYLLTAYILYFPNVSITAEYHVKRQGRVGPLGSETDLGRHLRANLPRRPPEDD